MSFDPAADPWGAAMLGTAVVVALAIFVLIAALLTGTPARAGKRLLGLGCLLFLGTAVGGTWQRIQDHARTQAEANKPPRETVTIVAPEPPGADDSDGGDDSPPGDAGADPREADDGTPEPDPEPDPTPVGSPDPEPDPEPEPEPEPEPPRAATTTALFDLSKVDLAEPAPLPSDPDAKKKAVTAALYSVRTLADDPKQCIDAQAVGQAWKQLRALPPDTARIGVAVTRLEACRKKIRASKAYAVRRKRIDARNEFANKLPTELRIDDSYVFVNVRGQSHEKIRIGGKSISEARANKLLAAGMEKQLVELGFTEATFASGTDTLTKTFDVVSDSDMTDKIMARWGLGEPLSLDDDA